MLFSGVPYRFLIEDRFFIGLLFFEPPSLFPFVQCLSTIEEGPPPGISFVSKIRLSFSPSMALERHD